MSDKVKGSLFSKLFNLDYEKSKKIMESLGGLSGDGKSGFAQSSFLLSPEKQKEAADSLGIAERSVNGSYYDLYGPLRSEALRVSKSRKEPVPVFRLYDDSIQRDGLTVLPSRIPFYSYHNKDNPPHLNAGTYQTRQYINPDTGTIYEQIFDLNDYGGKDIIRNPAHLIGRVLDRFGTPSIINSGIYTVSPSFDQIMNPDNEYDQRDIDNYLDTLSKYGFIEEVDGIKRLNNEAIKEYERKQQESLESDRKKYNDDFEKKVKHSQGGDIHRLMSGTPVTGQQQQSADLSMLRRMPTQQQQQQAQQPAAPQVPASAYDLVSKEEKIQFLSDLFAQSSIKGLNLSGADIREIFDEQWRNRGQEE